jgi:hypothetical protein
MCSGIELRTVPCGIASTAVKIVFFHSYKWDTAGSEAGAFVYNCGEFLH